jgi:hypothetical protein
MLEGGQWALVQCGDDDGRLERKNIAVDVGQDRQTHRASYIRYIHNHSSGFQHPIDARPADAERLGDFGGAEGPAAVSLASS